MLNDLGFRYFGDTQGISKLQVEQVSQMLYDQYCQDCYSTLNRLNKIDKLKFVDKVSALKSIYNAFKSKNIICPSRFMCSSQKLMIEEGTAQKY